MAINFNEILFLSKHLVELKSVTSAEQMFFIQLLHITYEYDMDLSGDYISYDQMKKYRKPRSNLTYKKHMKSLCKKSIINTEIKEYGALIDFRPYLELIPKLKSLDEKLEKEL